MIAFDTDILTELLLGNPAFCQRAAQIPSAEQAVPIVVIEEIIRGRLNVLRQAEAGKSKINVERAYELLQQTLFDFGRILILSYTSQAEKFFQQWRNQKVRLSTHDLRIAAICVAHSAKLISRNRKDFERVAGLPVEFWD